MNGSSWTVWAGRGLVALLPLTTLAAGSSPARAGQARVAGVQVGASDVTAGLERGPGTSDARLHASVDAPVRARQWALERVQFERAWSVTRGAGVVVAVLDTGVDPAQADLRGRLLPGATFNGAGHLHRRGQTDVDGHGTHVAGIVAARPAKAGGVSGGAPDVKILPVKVLGDDGSGWGSDAADGLVWAVDHGADVVNMSFGSPSPSEALRRAVGYAQQHGVLLVAAAGNDGAEGLWEYPAAYPGVVAVGAVDPGDQAAPFSTTGPVVDLAAPGESILSTIPTAVRAAGQARLSGTSMAAPYACAAAALVLAASPGLTGAEVADRLEQTAEDLGPAGRDDQFGAGLIDPARAVGAARAALPPRLAAPTGLAVRELADDTVSLTWDAVEGARSYEVLSQGLPLNLGVEFGDDPVYGLHGTTAHFPFFPHGLPVPLQVVAVDERGLWSPPSTALKAFFAAKPVAAPTAVRGASPRSGTAVVTWTDRRARGVIAYLVLRDGEVHGVVEARDRRFVDDATGGDAPVDGRAYEYRVVTETADGESDPSRPVVVRPYASWATSAPTLSVQRAGRAVRVGWSRPVAQQRGWRVFLDGALLRELPAEARYVDVSAHGTHRVTVVRFRTARDQGPRATTTIRG